MGIKIDLPIKTLEEANVLDKALLDSAEHRKAARKLIHTTQEEAARYDAEYVILLTLRERLLGKDV